MLKTEVLHKDLTKVGEEIGHELGGQMIKDYQTANPGDTIGYYIGRQIIEQILAQPGCVGINFYNAYNEKGNKNLVYIGVDEFNSPIIEYTIVNDDGSFDLRKAIVADRNGDVYTGPAWVPKWLRPLIS